VDIVALGEVLGSLAVVEKAHPFLCRLACCVKWHLRKAPPNITCSALISLGEKGPLHNHTTRPTPLQARTFQLISSEVA